MAKRFNTETRERLGKLIPMLSSDKDGEIINAVGAIKRTLQANGADIHDLAAKLSSRPRETVPLAIVPGITINNKPATADMVRQFVRAFNELQKENKDLKEKLDNLQVEYDELKESKSEPITLGHKIADGVMERLFSLPVVLLLIWWFFIH